MSELADALELLHRGGSGFRTIRASIRVWKDAELSLQAFHREGDEAERRGMNVMRMRFEGKGSGDETPPIESTELVRLWFEPPARARVESESEGRRSTVVTDGVHEWRLSDGRVVRGPAKPAHEVAATVFLLRPWTLLPSYLFEPLGQTTVSGREVIEVRARLRPGDGEHLRHVHGFSWGADEHLLALDRERGVLLRAASFLDGREYEVTEITEVAFDEPIEAEVFRLDPPPRTAVLTAEEEIRRLHREHPGLSHPNPMEQMARQVAFTVFAPSPDGPPITGQSTSFREDHITATFTQVWGDEEHSFDLVQRAADGDDSQPEGGQPGQTRVFVRRDSTRIDASSWTLDAEQLRQIVDALEPVRVK